MYTKQYDVINEHLDFQGVVDGLYFPFYMEWCRHSYLKEVAGIDIELEFRKGFIYTMTNMSISYKKSLYSNDRLTVSCDLSRKEGEFKFIFHERIFVMDKICAEAYVTAVCLKEGRPIIPDPINKLLEVRCQSR